MNAAPPSIQPLDGATRAGAVALVRATFPDEDLLERVLVAIMGTPLQPLGWFLGVRHQRVWVATEAGRVVGVTGLYEDEDDAPAALWLGWFCVDPAHRGRGLGSALLDFSISEAHRSNKAFLRVLTSDAPEEQAAQSLYERRGLVITRRRPEPEGGEELVRELRLNTPASLA